MAQYLDLMLATAQRARGYTEKLLVGIRPDQAARKPKFESDGAPTIVDTNHPSFVIGHLGLYLARIMTVTGLDATKVAAPKGWDELFKAGVACHDDPHGTIYPKFEVLTAHYFAATDATLEALKGLDDAILLQPTPDEKARQHFAQIGGVLNFLLNNHVMMHMGQVSAWRRCMGLPSAM